MTLRAFDVFDEVAAYSRARGTSRTVMLLLARMAGNPQRAANPKVETLAAMAMLDSRSQAQRILGALERAGELAKAKPGGGRGRAAVWQIEDLVELYGEPLQFLRRRAPAANQRPLVATVRNRRTDAAVTAGTETVAQTAAQTAASITRPRTEGKKDLRTPPAPRFAGGDDKPARALRANGTNPRAAAATAVLEQLGLVDGEGLVAWAAIAAEIRDAVTDAVWHGWLSELDPIGVDNDGRLVVAAPRQAHAYAADRFGRLVTALAARAGAPVRFATPTEASALQRLAS